MSIRAENTHAESSKFKTDYQYSEKTFIIDIKMCEESDWVVRLNKFPFQFKLLVSKQSSSSNRRISNSNQAEIISVNTLSNYFNEFTMLPAIHSFELHLKTLSEEFPISVYKENRLQAIEAFLSARKLTNEYKKLQTKYIESNEERKNQEKRQQNGPTNNNTNARNNVAKRLTEKVDAMKSKVSKKQKASEIVALFKELEKSIKQERLMALEEQYNI